MKASLLCLCTPGLEQPPAWARTKSGSAKQGEHDEEGVRAQRSKEMQQQLSQRKILGTEAEQIERA